MGRFEDTPEYIQSMKMRPACDKALCDAFGVLQTGIERIPKGSPLFVLDQEFAIDLRVKLPNGSQITGQEKALSNKFYSFRTFTMEFWQNKKTMEKGEFFKIASQFYLHGYSDESGTDFIEWHIIDVLKLLEWLKQSSTELLSSKTRPAGGSNAWFLPIPYDKIPKEFILKSYRRR